MNLCGETSHSQDCLSCAKPAFSSYLKSAGFLLRAFPLFLVNISRSLILTPKAISKAEPSLETVEAETLEQRTLPPLRHPLCSLPVNMLQAATSTR